MPTITHIGNQNKEIKKNKEAPNKFKTVLGMSEFAVKKTRQLITVSENRQFSNKIDKWRVGLQLDAIRVLYYSANGERRNVAKEVLLWNLNLNEINPNSHLNKDQCVFVKNKKNIMTVEQVREYLGDYYLDSKAARHKDKTKITRAHEFEKIAKLSAEHGVGNCGECSSTAMQILKELKCTNTEKKYNSIEMLYLDGKGDHTFLVINRKYQSDLSNPHSWGNDAILVDAWSNECGYIKHMLQNKNSILQKYIMKYHHEIEVNVKALVGFGHTMRWKDRCQQKSRNPNITFWNPRNTKNVKENIPFATQHKHKFNI